MTLQKTSEKTVGGRIPKRFDRVARLFGEPATRRLMTSHVAVFGLGGVGSYAAEGLARSGIGHLTLVDFDEVCLTNFNRQLHAVEGSIGKSKAELMEQRIRQINPACNVKAPVKFYEANTSEELMTPLPDFVVDCIDNVTAKLHLLSTCVEKGVPMVTCLGASAKIDPEAIRIASLTKTHTDPFAQTIRKNLRRKYKMSDEDMSKITAVFSDEEPRWPDKDYKSTLCGVDCICPSGQNAHHTCQKRRVIYGSAVFVTSMFGMMAASVVVRRLAGIEIGESPA